MLPAQMDLGDIIATPISVPFLPGKCGEWVQVNSISRCSFRRAEYSSFSPTPEPAPTSCTFTVWCVLCGLITPQGTGCTKKCIASILAFTSHTMKLELDSVPWKELSTSFEDQILLTHIFLGNCTSAWHLLAMFGVFEYFSVPYSKEFMEKCLLCAILCTSLCFNDIFYCPETYYNHFLFPLLRFEQAFITSLISSVVNEGHLFLDRSFKIKIIQENTLGRQQGRSWSRSSTHTGTHVSSVSRGHCHTTFPSCFLFYPRTHPLCGPPPLSLP